MAMTEFALTDLEDATAHLEDSDAFETLAWAYEQFGDGMAMATGFGPEGVVLIDILSRVRSNPNVFFLDTGFLFRQTHALREKLSERYGIDFQRVSSKVSVNEQSRQFGDELWARDPDLCCGIRKVSPLAEHLSGLQAWITSIRRSQTKQRASIKPVEWDAKFELVKVNPLANWTSEDVWEYIHAHNLLYNELHDRGYPSIGCTHCTRAVQAGEAERAGRWSWTTKTECGLHA